jgi:hypothetical protein
MITCPNCQAQNEPGSRFCISCGQGLESVSEKNALAAPQDNIYHRTLGLATGQTLIALFLVWVVQTVLVSLSFVEGLRLPSVPLTMPQIITTIAYLVAIVLLVVFANKLGSYWPRAYPRLASLTTALTAVVYIVLISLAYRALLPVINSLVDNPSDFILILRVALTILALVLLIQATQVIYEALSGWLSGFRFNLPKIVSAEVACLNCGRLNVSGMKFCNFCGQAAIESE